MRISHSALSMYLECKYKYFLSYMLKLRPKVKKTPLCFGDAIDVGLNHLLETRNLVEALAKFEEQWGTYENQGLVYSKSDFDAHLFSEEEHNTPGAVDTFESLRRRGLILLSEFNDQIMPRIKRVIAVQVNRYIPNDVGDQLTVKTDFICEWEDGTIVLFDNKTTSVAYAEDSVRVSKQLAIYYETLKEEFGLQKAGYIVIPKRINKKKLPRVNITVIIDDIDEATIVETLEEYDQKLTEIKSGDFEPNHNACMGKFGKCEYYSFCHRGDLEGLEYKDSK